MGQTIIGLSALTEIATFAYNLLKGHMLFFFLKIGLKINEISISQKHLIKKYNNWKSCDVISCQAINVPVVLTNLLLPLLLEDFTILWLNNTVQGFLKVL